MTNHETIPFAEQDIRFDEGRIAGEPLRIETGDPVNFHQAISDTGSVPRTTIDGKLFLPSSARKPLPVVIVVPGSLGVAPSHLRHAEAFTAAGFAACVIDPFGARQVTSTVANQTQYSFAASAWDVLATAQHLNDRNDIRADMIGAQGHSRGGSAVLTAATLRFAEAMGTLRLRAVYAAYPWCGQQFLDPDIGNTRVRAVIGDRDEWCLPQQVQGHVHAIQLTGGDASMQIFAGAQHSFDRDTPIESIDEASVSPGAPTSYIAADGAFIHPLKDTPDPALTDRDLMVYGLKAGYGHKGARIGSQDDDATRFEKDMLRFWQAALS